MRRRRGGPEDLLAWKEGRRWRDVRSGDINDYIQEAIGSEFSAKDFRTWSGTVLAAAALAGEEEPPSDAAAKRTINRAVKTVAAALGNTPAVCRRSYIDPRVFDRYRDGETIDLGRRVAAEGTMSERTRQRIERLGFEPVEHAEIRPPAEAGDKVGGSAGKQRQRFAGRHADPPRRRAQCRARPAVERHVREHRSDQRGALILGERALHPAPCSARKAARSIGCRCISSRKTSSR